MSDSRRDANPTAFDAMERQATSAYLAGDSDTAEALWTRAHNEYLEGNSVPRAARCIFWLVLDLFNRREWARGNGWLTRGLHQLEPEGECAELGLLLALVSRNQLRSGEMAAAERSATQASELARRFQDSDLHVFSRLALALVHARRSEAKEAASLFDEIMVGVTVDKVSPIAVGVVYCAVIDACRSLFDLGRAREWTHALDRWVSAQENTVAFRGKCLVHRAEILRQSGDWSEALAEAERACAWCNGHENSFRFPSGAAFYELGEVHRLRGNVEAATEAYRRANEYGQSPEPGLALLQFSEGKLALATASIRRLLAERQGGASRPDILLAAVEILIAAGDTASAGVAVDELSRLQDQFPAPALRALCAHATGALCLAGGDLPMASRRLREAWTLWQQLEVPYQAARVRVLLGQVCRQLGDDVTAKFEFDAARRFFERVSAHLDVARVTDLEGRGKTDTHTLSARERQVIALVATGKTNREIARELSISQRTVDRHVSNILLKLSLPSRSAATAYAYQHDLIGRTG